MQLEAEYELFERELHRRSILNDRHRSGWSSAADRFGPRVGCARGWCVPYRSLLATRGRLDGGRGFHPNAVRLLPTGSSSSAGRAAPATPVVWAGRVATTDLVQYVAVAAHLAAKLRRAARAKVDAGGVGDVLHQHRPTRPVRDRSKDAYAKHLRRPSNIRPFFTPVANVLVDVRQRARERFARGVAVTTTSSP